MGRTPCGMKNEVKKRLWTPEEDKLLVDYIQLNGLGTPWHSLPKLAGLQRCGNSCKRRWINYLRPDIKKGPFTSEEEDIIIQKYSELGHRFAAIASYFPGRTDNGIRNFLNKHLRKCIASEGVNQQENRSGELVDEAIGLRSGTPPTCHMVQWESARVEAESRFSVDPLLLKPPSLTVKPEPDYFLRLWNSEVGESFRKNTKWEGLTCRSTGSQSTSSAIVDDSGSGVTVQQDEWNKNANPASCKTGTPSTCHVVQWGSARVEAESWLSVDPLLLKPPSLAVKPEPDYFLRLWNSDVGESFRKNTKWEGLTCQNTRSQSTSSAIVDDSVSGVSVQQDEWSKNANPASCQTGSDSLETCESKDSDDNFFSKLIDFVSSRETTEFTQQSIDDVSIYLKDECD